MNQLVKTILDKLFLLQKLRKYITCYAAIQIYKSMVLPYFNYGDIIYQGARNKYLDKSQKLVHKIEKCTTIDGLSIITLITIIYVKQYHTLFLSQY